MSSANLAEQVLILGADLLDPLSAAAKLSPRLRHNLNLHASTAEAVQRFFNAVEPGTYVPVHRHTDADKAETLIVVRGAIGIVLFNDAGSVTHHQRIAANTANFGAHIPAGVWHTLVSLQSGSVFFEVKAGPYAPDTAQEIAPWAPAANSDEAKIYVQSFTHFFP